ncbi:MAG: VWA domain-containing protein, partial [Verrucomicrobia bacterium]|nr:VWA domain-containing protein [Verrucomicrobiota bacterium]
MKRFSLCAAILLLAVAQSFGAGFVVVSTPLDDAQGRQAPIGIPPFPHPIPPRPFPFAPFEVTSHKVSAKITDQLAVTTVEQEFYNPNPQPLEGTFMFPVPRGAQLSKFTMEIDGKKADAELLDAAKALKIYEDIVRNLRDPALLEYAGRDVFRIRIFPIEPHGRKRITLSYTQLLRSDSGLVSYVCPLSADKFSARPIKNVSLRIELDTARPLKALYSPTHKVEVKREPRHATIGYEAANERPETDFQLYFSQEQSDIGLSLLAHKTAGDDGYFVLLAAPGVESKGVKPQPKDVTFVLDTSGSMAGGKLEQAKKALLFCVENLNENDRFEILRFSTEVEPLFDKLVDAEPANRKRAANFIKELKPLGSTAIDEALKKALTLTPPGGAGKFIRPYVIIFLTDGMPTVGVTDDELILRNVRERNTDGTRIFCFGIGTDVNTHLLDRIADLTRAYSQYVLPEEDLEVKLSAFFTKVKEPALANLKLTFPDGVRVTKTYPTPLPDLFRGDQLMLAGRYSGHGRGKVAIEGTINGERRRFEAEVEFSETSVEHEFIPRL